MALCPTCFNSPDNCECDPPYTGALASRASSSPQAAKPASASIDGMLLDVDARRRHHLHVFLTAVLDLGCWIETPPAVRQDYVNVQPPRAYGGGRLCSVTRSTGRIEFQTDTYAIAERLGVSARFTYLAAGAKAAITPSSDEDVVAAVLLARAVLASRRAMA